MTAETALAAFLNKISNIGNNNEIRTVTDESRINSSGNLGNQGNTENSKSNQNPGFSLPEETRIDIKEHLEERAAIIEFDGGLSRKEAENAALSSIRIYAYRVKDAPEKEPVMIAHDIDLDEARRILTLRYGERLMIVSERKIDKELFK